MGDWLEVDLENAEKYEDEPAKLCSDCPPENYPTDKTRCLSCPRRT